MATLVCVILMIPLFWVWVYVMFILDGWIPETYKEFKTKWHENLKH